MKYKITLKREQLFSDLFPTLTTYVNDLDKRGKHDYEAICLLKDSIQKYWSNTSSDKTTIVQDRKQYMSYVNEALDRTIELLTYLEDLGRLTELELNEFDAICRIVNESNEIEDSEYFQVGKMIVCEGLPYQIIEIDYEDFSVRLWSGDEDDKGYWESPLNCVGKI
tara:strand:- start:483 stop:980 length:498 start_codon:yes stop_codon:yes gene_type:complete